MKRIIVVLCVFVSTYTVLCAYNPPTGGEAANTFFSPDLLGGQTSATGGPFGDGNPADLATNPSLSAYEQRIIFDASYAAIIGFTRNTNNSGLKGHLANADFLYPSRWGVFATGIHFFNSSFDALPWGTAGSLRLSYAKDLTDKLALGVGLYGLIGSGYGVGADIGALYRFGDLGFAKDSKVGVSLTGLGKPYNAQKGGVKGLQNTSGFPGMFTPHVGFATTLISVKNFKVGTAFDLSFPTFQNFIFDTGLHMKFADMLTIKTGWSFNLVETLYGRHTYLPSFALACSIKLNSKDKLWEQSDITPQFAAKPLSQDIWALGAGVNVKVGRTDTVAPVISIDYPKTKYISPNSDGVQDVLEFPLSITDERYVTSWLCTIENENGEVVRTIANKEVRPGLGKESFWKLLTKVKSGVAIPKTLRWDGMLDSGTIAPDGTYYFSITASDDNNNQARSERYAVVVDNTPPVITLSPPSGQNAFIFSPDGDGNKDTFLIKQSGSVEQRWTATVSTAANKVVRTVETREAAPTDFAWDGKTDSGEFAPDGLYTYTVTASDRAGNSVAQSVSNIIVDTVKPSVGISISTNAFSPNGDGIKDTVTLTPSISVQSGLQEWKIDIQNAQNRTVRTIDGARIAPLIFDGKDNDGTVLPDGVYTALLSARYVNGYTPASLSPVLSINVTVPKARARSSGTIFSPDGDGKLDTLTFTQMVSAGDSWTAEVYALDSAGNISGTPVRRFALTKDSSDQFIWDGRNDAGAILADGTYAYRLVGRNDAGNTGYSDPVFVELNTEKADVVLSSNVLAFSPNKDGVQDSIVFSPKLKSNTAVASYTFSICDEAGTVVKTLSGTGKVPSSIRWDGIADTGDEQGRLCADGTYTAAIEVTLTNGQTARSTISEILLDTQYPEVELDAPYRIFSTDSAAQRHVLPVAQTASAEDLWTGSITDGGNKAVRTFTWEGRAGDFDWDGTDDSGNKVPDGSYRYSIFAQDSAGNKTVKTLENIAVDSRVPKAYLTAEYKAFSPNGDGIQDAQSLRLHTTLKEGIAFWSVSIIPVDAGSTGAVKRWSSEKGDAFTDHILWDGTDDAGNVNVGTFVAELSLRYTKGDELSVRTTPFTLVVQAPELSVAMLPKYFSPDNDGNEDELFINLSVKCSVKLKQWSFEIREPEDTGNKLFWSIGGKDKISEKIVWDGRSLQGEIVQSATDYPYIFTVTDEVGLTSVIKGYVPIDVLVLRDGDKLKIAVPSIIFRKNAADFKELEQKVVDRNIKVLTRIAQILNKFPDYKVQVEGHANNTTGTQREEEEDLIPLSAARAAAVRNFLIEKGVMRSRLSSVGIGGTQPIASFSDRANWWKNRRVEFVLIK